MSIWEALILGIVQGITEFLPVSSSGHLVLMKRVFGITEPALIFDIAVHVGTLVAVFAVLWRDIWSLLRRIVQPLTLYLIIGTIPAGIAALLFSQQIENAFASGAYLGFAFLVTSALLFFSEKLSRKSLAGTAANQSAGKKMTWIDAVFIGLLQALAIMPGISRSGATISGGLVRGLDREFAVRFSFLLSIPAILGALVLHAGELLELSAADPVGPLEIAIGTISAAIVGFFSIRLALNLVRKRSLKCFAVYTGILGVLVIIDKFGTRFFF